MTAEEFIEEVTSSEIAPFDFVGIYNRFQFFQKLAIDTLNNFHQVCIENDITYVLAYGSLLGAVRDNGQIPWDYDIDVFVPFEERLDLVKALKKCLKSEYYFYCPETSPKCRHEFIRIAPKGFRTEELHVDVFYLTGAPDDYDQIKTIADRITKLSKLRYFKLVKTNYASYGNIKTFIRLIMQKCLYFMKSHIKAQQEYLSICSEFKAKESKYNITADTFSGEVIYKSKSVWKTTLVKTNIGEYFIPFDCDTILRQTYGDYTKIPPLENRVDEVLYHYGKLNKYAEII